MLWKQGSWGVYTQDINWIYPLVRKDWNNSQLQHFDSEEQAMTTAIIRCHLCGTFTFTPQVLKSSVWPVQTQHYIKTVPSLVEHVWSPSCAFRCQIYTIFVCDIISFHSCQQSVVTSVLCWCNGALLCLTLSHITSRLLFAEDTEHCELKQNSL